MAKRKFVWVEQAAVIQAMRRTFRRYPGYQETKARCRREWQQDCKNGNKRLRVSYLCESCKKEVASKDWKCDHISPVVDPTVGFVDYNTYAARLFCSAENLQGLCDPCHKVKSKQEAAVRAKARKEKSKK